MTLCPSGPLSPPAPSLSPLALQHIETTLALQGSSLTGKGLQAITALVATLERGLIGGLPDAFYLSSIDPGMGKTLSVTSFIKAWKDQGFLPSSSVLIAVSRVEQIAGLINDTGLKQSEVAVETSDDGINDLGAPRSGRKAAPVLITTHEMVRRRTGRRPFSQAGSLTYLGAPRTLRIWDETFLPAQPATLRLDTIAGLAEQYRGRHPALISMLTGLLATWLVTDMGTTVQIPEELAGLIPNVSNDRRLGSLRLLAGQPAQLVHGGHLGPALIGISKALPDDIAPMVVLDASGRVRATYRLWEDRQDSLVRLPGAASDYRDLEVHLWQRGSGKATLENPNARGEICNAVAEIINREQASRWLIVYQKDREDMLDDIVANVTHDASARISSLTWGRHDATNAFKDIENVVVIGQLTYGDLGVHALAFAAAGELPVPGQRVDTLDFQWSEFQHNLLQALARASVRKSHDGRAGACRAYVIATPSPHTFGRVAATFPGCRLTEWDPAPKPTPGHVANAIEYLLGRFSDQDVREVPKGDLSGYLDIKPQNLARLLKHEQVQAFLDEERIFLTVRSLVSRRPSFKPIALTDPVRA